MRISDWSSDVCSSDLSATNDRYINDAQVTQAVAQYLSRIGIKTQVDTVTSSVYFPKRAKREMSAALGGWGQVTGEAGNFMPYWVTTNNKDRGVDRKSTRLNSGH